jgi:isopenicillin N synthase-like dioxygenase
MKRDDDDPTDASTPPNLFINMKRLASTESDKPSSNKRPRSKASSIVCLKYSDLLAEKDLSLQISEAFGEHGLGILAVTGVPDCSKKRSRLLQLAPIFANYSDDIKAKYEHPESYWSFGWSHGKEKLQGRPDFAKGSYYNNPCENAPFGSDPTTKTIQEYMSFAHPNIWPTEELPDLEHAFMDLGKTMCSVGQLVAKQCDTYVSSVSEKYEKGKLARVLGESKVTKARLLHYFPKEEEQRARAHSVGRNVDTEEQHEQYRGRSGSFSEQSTTFTEVTALAPSAPADAPLEENDDFSSWCGWHNDHGSLTALCPAMYFEHKSDGTLVALDKSPDDQAGLYIRSRDGSLHHVKAPSTSDLLFQIGETSQIHSGGILQATPHAVKGVNVPNVCRSTFACFMEPGWEELMNAPSDRTAASAQSSKAELSLPKGVSPLNARWGSNACPFTTCNFGDFTSATLGALH